jgi:uncharacterized Fe-S radical SAM superfamily protein PflX
MKGAKQIRLPLVSNTSAYDGLEGLRVLDGLADIYMPDFKLWDAEAVALAREAGLWRLDDRWRERSPWDTLAVRLNE